MGHSAVATNRNAIGTCGINEWEQDDHCAEAGFWIFPEYWGKGVMLECLSAMLDYCFTKLSLHRMQSMVEPDNPASWKLIEKLGFQLEGILRECERRVIAMSICDAILYSHAKWQNRAQPAGNHRSFSRFHLVVRNMLCEMVFYTQQCTQIFTSSLS